MESLMTRPLPLVSIVCPAFEEEEVLPIFHQHLKAVLARLESRFRFEIIFVDDGSLDRTLEVLRSIAQTDRAVSYLSLSRNFGHQAALTAGLEHARGDAVISMDADMQHPPAVLEELLNHWQDGYEVVVTIRQDDQRIGRFKRYTSRAFYGLMQLLSDIEIRIAASDFRLLSRRAVQALLQLKEQHRFVRGMVQWLGFPVKECVFRPEERAAGYSKYTLMRMVRLAGDGLFSFSRVPLRLPIFLALGFFGLALVHALLAVVGLWQETGFSAWHYLVMSVDLGIGCMLGSVSILGEYLGRVHEEVKARPLYLLKECQLRPLEDVAVPDAEAGASYPREAA
jgi:glycosyltransferase involved in cell wall biosynthesis